jgi:hypothetical protein
MRKNGKVNSRTSKRDVSSHRRDTLPLWADITASKQLALQWNKRIDKHEGENREVIRAVAFQTTFFGQSEQVIVSVDLHSNVWPKLPDVRENREEAS